MAAEQAEGFADNWAYLRTELYWLERLLISTVAKQQKEAKEIERVARSKADRATSHWWKGIINTEGSIAYDEYRKPAGKTHHQQIELQIQSSRQQGVALALPNLRDRLSLSPFEKNVVLLSLAPEVNRRYSQLYRYLQGETASSDLPTLDLALRLFCKTDQEWRTARNHLISKSRLTRYRLLRLLPSPDTLLLSSSLQLADRLVNYLLSDQPTPQSLDAVLKACITAPAAPIAPSDQPLTLQPKIAPTAAPILQQQSIRSDWADLVLPEATIAALQQIGQQIQGYRQAVQQWNLSTDWAAPGLAVLLTGDRSRSQQLAAAALATELETPWCSLNLAAIDPVDFESALAEIAEAAPTVLLIQSAELWLKRSTLLSSSSLQQFFAERQAQAAITLLTVVQPAAVQCCWRSCLHRSIEFPPLTPASRTLLWPRAFPAQVPIDPSICWSALADLPFNEAEIYAIAQATVALAAHESADQMIAPHLIQILAQHGQSVSLQTLTGKTTKRRSQRSRPDA